MSCVCPCSVIFLAFLLASGLLLVILSCALYYNWWPLFVSTLPAHCCGELASVPRARADGRLWPVPASGRAPSVAAYICAPLPNVIVQRCFPDDAYTGCAPRRQGGPGDLRDAEQSSADPVRDRDGRRRQGRRGGRGLLHDRGLHGDRARYAASPELEHRLRPFMLTGRCVGCRCLAVSRQDCPSCSSTATWYGAWLGPDGSLSEAG